MAFTRATTIIYDAWAILVAASVFVGTVFVGLRVLGSVTWEWIWVLSPIFFGGVLFVGLLIVAFIDAWRNFGTIR